MNGRRTTITPAEGPGGVDTNLMPIAAIGRVEVLKDGAAATYGSDAIAGVVNFITRRDLDGLEIQGEYKDIDGSDGDYTTQHQLGLARRRRFERAAVDWRGRVAVKSARRARLCASGLYVNPTGWSAFSTPGTFAARNLTGPSSRRSVASVLDSNCNALGGFQTPGVCRFSYMPFDNLVEKTEQEQAYGEVNSKFGSNTEFHIEGLYAQTDLPNYRTSPGYPPLTGPTGPGTAFTATSVGPTPWANNPGVLEALQQATSVRAQRS